MYNYINYDKNFKLMNDFNIINEVCILMAMNIGLGPNLNADKCL